MKDIPRSGIAVDLQADLDRQTVGAAGSLLRSGCGNTRLRREGFCDFHFRTHTLRESNNALPEKEMGEKEVNEMEFAISKSVRGI